MAWKRSSVRSRPGPPSFQSLTNLPTDRLVAFGSKLQKHFQLALKFSGFHVQFLMNRVDGRAHAPRNLACTRQWLWSRVNAAKDSASFTNEYRHSAAEMVASFAKDNHLAAVVGTRTAAEVLGGANFKLSKGYRLRIPVAGWYTWRGDCIEGKGRARYQC